MKRRTRLCALAAAFALLAGCIPQPTPPLHSKGEVLFELQKSYGIEFVLLSSEPYDDAFVVNGKHYVAAPADDPDFRFDVYDLVKVQNYGPIPAIFPEKYHTFGSNFIDGHLKRRLLRFCAENQLRCASDGTEIILPAEGWEETVTLLAGYLESLNGIFPFNTGQPPYEMFSIRFRHEVYPGVSAWESQSFFDWGTCRFGFDGEEMVSALRTLGERNYAAVTFSKALAEFLDASDVSYKTDLPEQFDDCTYPSVYFTIYLPSEDEADRVFPLLDTFFAEQSKTELPPGAAKAISLVTIIFRKSDESTLRELYSPFHEEPPYLSFQAEAVQARVLRGLFPKPHGENQHEGSNIVITDDFISGDRITIDGDKIIVEGGGETVVVDRSDGSTESLDGSADASSSAGASGGAGASGSNSGTKPLDGGAGASGSGGTEPLDGGADASGSGGEGTP